ncbi:hypothetical protein Zmor_001828 [Zophobas morio]|uniref:Uncharacterized protein n=1 Tax=Zophobas morio TaxID=2755281 RepID=A0AA38J2T1_9CUCU|nr:hypothetical protein Zmor_001828 [Zophobas morio]
MYPSTVTIYSVCFPLEFPAKETARAPKQPAVDYSSISVRVNKTITLNALMSTHHMNWSILDRIVGPLLLVFLRVVSAQSKFFKLPKFPEI